MFGDFQDFIDMEKLKSGNPTTLDMKVPNMNKADDAEREAKVDLREYRPLEVTVNCTLHDIRAYLLKVVKSTNLHSVAFSVNSFCYLSEL